MFVPWKCNIRLHPLGLRACSLNYTLRTQGHPIFVITLFTEYNKPCRYITRIQTINDSLFKYFILFFCKMVNLPLLNKVYQVVAILIFCTTLYVVFQYTREPEFILSCKLKNNALFLRHEFRCEILKFFYFLNLLIDLDRVNAQPLAGLVGFTFVETSIVFLNSLVPE